MLRYESRSIVWLFDGMFRCIFPAGLTHSEPFERGPMGVFIAQVLTVLLGLALLVLSLAVLALLATAAREQRLSRVKVAMQPSRGRLDQMDCPIRSVIDRGNAAPSRAPPDFQLRARHGFSLDDSADCGAG
jgi:hypothetical protein